MSTYAFAITKRASFRGENVEFSNIYHYSNLNAAINFDAALDWLRDTERPLFASDVSFVQGRAWGPTGEGMEVSKTVAIKDFAINGLGTATTGMYRELALLVHWPLGRYGRFNRPQFLRKWLHTWNGQAYPTDGSGKLSAPNAAMTTYSGAITTPPAGGVLAAGILSTEGGRVAQGPAVWYPYLEHRQFGR